MDSHKGFSYYDSTLLLLPSSEYNDLIISILEKLNNDKICYVTLNKTYFSLVEIFQKNNINMDNIFFIDGITKSIRSVDHTENCYFVSSPQALTEISIAITKFLEKRFDVIIFDSLNTLLNYQKSRNIVIKFSKSIINRVKSMNCRGIYYAIETTDSELIDATSMIVDSVQNMKTQKSEDPSAERTGNISIKFADEESFKQYIS
jgi:hypothetical protein